MALFSKKLSDAEENYRTNEREFFALAYFLKRFRCYLEGSTSEVFKDNHFMKHLFTKPTLTRREGRWLDLFAQFCIHNIALKPGRIYVSGDVLSRASHALEAQSLNNLNILSLMHTTSFKVEYDIDQIFGPIVRAFNGYH